jgi:hypothetical protein
MDDVHIRLARRFRKQQEFTAGYSPLYSQLFGIVADWMDAGPGSDPLMDWLVRAAAGRSSFDVPLLLLAGLHRDILAGCTESQALARYFPSMGGTLLPQESDITACLRQTLVARRDQLAAFLRTATVQTNETARGLCWLLPVCYPGWESIHVVDLGASAGLNLLADQRHYRLLDTATGEICVDLGSGSPVQFSVAGAGPFVPPVRTVPPIIRSRIGCDLAPCVLQSADDERTLAAFVWGDQLQRLAQLRQGIDVLHRLNQTAVPVRLYQTDLPERLPQFLEERIGPLTDVPVVLYNTYLTTYLRDRGASLRPRLAEWALQRLQPVLWLQWETLWKGPQPPDFGWVGWTADFWQKGVHRQWHLAWAHPHGTRMQWLPDWAGWSHFWGCGHR